MLVHSDFLLRANVSTAELRWVASSQPGVERVMLDGRSTVHARATSLVRCAPASVFRVRGYLTGLAT